MAQSEQVVQRVDSITNDQLIHIKMNHFKENVLKGNNGRLKCYGR